MGLTNRCKFARFRAFSSSRCKSSPCCKRLFSRCGIVGSQDILTVTNHDLIFKTEDEFREVNTAKLATSFTLEPFERNTSAAIAAAVLHMVESYSEDTITLKAPFLTRSVTQLNWLKNVN